MLFKLENKVIAGCTFFFFNVSFGEIVSAHLKRVLLQKPEAWRMCAGRKKWVERLKGSFVKVPGVGDAYYSEI